MATKTILVSLLLTALGVAVAVAGFMAEAKRVKESQLNVFYVASEPECEYPSTPAMGLALAAIAALIVARVIITSATGGCCSCLITAPNRSIFARACIVLSWVASCVAVILFITGAKLNSQKGLEREVNGEYYCYTIRSGVFCGAGIVGLVSVLFGLVYYIWYNMVARSGAAEEPPVDLELQKAPIIDCAMKPYVALEKH